MGLTTGKFDPSKNIPQVNSGAQEWIQWHKTLKTSYGKKVANALWMKAWAIRGGSSANTADLRKYMSSQGITIDATSWNKLTDTVAGGFDFVGDVFQAGMYVTMGFSILILGGIGLLVFNIGRKPKDYAEVSAKMAASAAKALK